MKTAAWSAGLALLGMAAMAPCAYAQSDCTKVVPVSPFGAGDQTGATNRITPAVTKAAAAEIQTGKVTTMTNPLTDGVPLFGTRFTKTVLTANLLAPGNALGDNNLTYMEDTWLSQSHVGTHIDGLGHIGRGDCYYNQTADRQVHQPEQHDPAGARAPEIVCDARRHRRSGPGLSGCRQIEGQPGLQVAVPRQGNGNHA